MAVKSALPEDKPLEPRAMSLDLLQIVNANRLGFALVLVVVVVEIVEPSDFQLLQLVPNAWEDFGN